MARKKVEPITNLGSEDKLTVQKSLPLFDLWWRFTLRLKHFQKHAHRLPRRRPPCIGVGQILSDYVKKGIAIIEAEIPFKVRFFTRRLKTSRFFLME